MGIVRASDDSCNNAARRSCGRSSSRGTSGSTSSVGRCTSPGVGRADGSKGPPHLICATSTNSREEP